VHSNPTAVNTKTSPNPHIFPSYRNLALGALESLLEVAEKRPLKRDEMAFVEDDEPFYGTEPDLRKVIDSAPSIAPYDNPWIKARVKRPRISRLGIEFFKRVQREALSRKDTSE